jgi:hypothetical protein
VILSLYTFLIVVPQEKVSYADYPCSGLKQASIDIDVFLEPLMEDMQKLWEEGVHDWDAY